MLKTEQMTKTLREEFSHGHTLAKSRGNQEFDYLHVMRAIIENNDSVIFDVLRDAGIDQTEFTDEINSELSGFASAQIEGETPASRESKNMALVSKKALTAMQDIGDKYVATDTFFLGVVAVDDLPLTKFLSTAGATPSKVREVVLNLRRGKLILTPDSEGSLNILEKYGVDMLAQYRSMKKEDIVPISGRDTEIRQLSKVLMRFTKNNPILVGEAGVGKTAIVEGLAMAMAQGDVVDDLKGKQLYMLDYTAIVAGAKVRGEFEDRMKKIINEVERSNGEIFLFIDEIHMLLGGSGEGGNSTDASNILKPALARGKLHLIGATTMSEYKLYFDKDDAFSRRFERIQVEEPSRQSTIEILRGYKRKFQDHYHVQIADSAIQSAVDLSTRYITGRQLPDKAINVLDEACADTLLEISAMPDSLAKKENRVRIMRRDRQILMDDVELHDAEISEMDIQIRQLDRDITEETSEWRKNLSAMKDNSLNDLKKVRKETLEKVQTLLSAGDMELASRYQNEVIPSIDNKIVSQKQASTEKLVGFTDIVTTMRIRKTIAEMTGIPVETITRDRMQMITKLPEILRASVKGQDEAIEAISKTISRTQMGFNDPHKPIGSFLFLGPTGTGKTALAKALSDEVFGVGPQGSHNLLKLDMSEFQSQDSVNKLIGAPPGYVGYEESGRLTEFVRNHPYSEIIFDEIEKAHPKIFDLFLQVLDEGRLTDAHGHTVDFRNTLIIFTSNIGAAAVFDHLTEDSGRINDEGKRIMLKTLENYFRPEFIQRLSGTYVFNPINKRLAIDIVKAEAARTIQLVKKQYPGINIVLDENAYAWIADIPADGSGIYVNGARALQRLVETSILDGVTDMILNNQLGNHDTLTITTVDRDDSEIPEGGAIKDSQLKKLKYIAAKVNASQGVKV